MLPSIATAACGQRVAVVRRQGIGVERSGCIEARRSPDGFDDVLKLDFDPLRLAEDCKGSQEPGRSDFHG